MDKMTMRKIMDKYRRADDDREHCLLALLRVLAARPDVNFRREAQMLFYAADEGTRQREKLNKQEAENG